MNEYAKIPPRGFEGGRPNLGMQLPQFGMGSMSGIQSALQPLRGFISNQIQQQTNEKINPFIEEVATNAQETFDIQSGPQLGSLLQSNNMLSPYQPAAGFEGIKSLFQPAQNTAVVNENNYNRAVPMAQGGSVPRQTMIEDQPHMLAYINPQEEMMLRRMGGTGQPGPGGVPAYPPQSVNERDQYDRMEAVRNNLIDATNQNADDDSAQNAERARQIAFMDNPSFIVNDDRLLRRGTAASREAYGKRLTRRSKPQSFNEIIRPEPKSRAAQDAFIAAKQRSNFFQNNPAASGFENEGFIERGVKASIPYQMFNTLFNNRGIMRDKLAQQGNYPIRGIGGFVDSFFKTTPVKYEPIFDRNNKLIGTVGFSEKGTATNLQGRAVGFDAFGKPVDFSNVNANETGQETDTLVSPTAPVTCPDGYVYDSITNSCVAVESTAEETETTEASPIVVDPNVTVPTEYPLFNQGGVASLNDVARNMSRGPRGIAGYQTYMR